jgi:ribose transport system ATP-binding protein
MTPDYSNPANPTAGARRVGAADAVAALHVSELSKVFDSQRALDDVDLEVMPGEVHAFLGANGAGKSTLIKILAGYHTPEPGATVEVFGRPLAFGSPAASFATGLRFLHQDLGLIGTMTVAENLRLTNLARRPWISDRGDSAVAARVLERFGIDIDPNATVDSLRPSDRSMVAIARTVESGLGEGTVLVLDEPTAALPPAEVSQLFGVITRLKDEGVGILYVTHRLPEVYAIADRLTVIRSGRVVARESVADTTTDRLVELILGQSLERGEHRAQENLGEAVLEVDALAGGAVANATFTASAREIVGITGLMGSGYESVLSLVFGAQHAVAGEVTLAATPLGRPSPHQSISAGIAFAPADRRRDGAMPNWTLRENVTLPRLVGAGRLRWLSVRRERRDAAEWLERLSVTPSDPELRFGVLSGGNQQRAVIARWFRSGARLFLLDEPTFGVDAAAKQAIYTELRKVAETGAAVVVASSDTEELSELCDRVLVMGDGVIRESVSGGASPEEIFATTLRVSEGASDGLTTTKERQP